MGWKRYEKKERQYGKKNKNGNSTTLKVLALSHVLKNYQRRKLP